MHSTVSPVFYLHELATVSLLCTVDRAAVSPLVCPGPPEALESFLFSHPAILDITDAKFLKFAESCLERINIMEFEAATGGCDWMCMECSAVSISMLKLGIKV